MTLTEEEKRQNCAVFVNSFVQAAEVMDRLRKEAEARMRTLGFDFLYAKKQKLNKILRDCEEVRRLFDDVFLYGDHPIEAGLYDYPANYDGFLATASEMTILFLMIMDRCRTREQEQALFDLLNSMPGTDVSDSEIDKLKIQ